MRFPPHPPIRTMADIAAIEGVPLDESLRVWTAYDMIAESVREVAAKSAYHFLSEGTAEETPLTVTYAELGARMHTMANALHRLGLRPGETVAYLLPNGPATIDVLLGGTVAGTVAPLNWMLEPAHIAHILSATRAKILIVDEGAEIWAKAEAVLPRLTERPQVIRAGALAGLMARERDDALDGPPPAPDDARSISTPAARPAGPSSRGCCIAASPTIAGRTRWPRR
jgi:fatty-acyl-CoA synthase